MSAIFNPAIVHSYSATKTTDQSTTSSAFSDVTGTSITFTKAGDANTTNILVLYSGPAVVVANTLLMTFNMDAVDGSTLATSSLTSNITMTFLSLYTSLAAGSHTVKARFRNNDNVSSVSINGSSVANASIVALEVMK